ncbi:MAG: polysaccharide biosynthesis protein [Oscillospiraceae bacterium]|nr:polysaccharide biosynthesis protein [Oscillospiraceae bacterium]
MTGYYSDEATEIVLENKKKEIPYSQRKKLAVVGAGRIGAMLVKELLTNQNSAYAPVCFVDNDMRKADREIYGIPVIGEDDTIAEKLKAMQVEEIVFALPRMHAEQKNELYERYRKTGCKILIYDYPLSQTSEFGKRTLREFRVEELLFRDAKEFMNDDVRAFYAGKTILVTGGGGSIGSELCRQIAKMSPKKLVVLDVYENSAYDLQQELIMTYGRGMLPFEVEICSITDRRKLESVFRTYQPDVVLHAAAHKHVPLMEHNVVEAVENNIFGTRNVIDLAIQYHVSKFLMVSTDKAVNPTNVMGATKRMCEMMVMEAASRHTDTKFCATRFGNVLASNGSVVPLFKKQIANGGPVTVTDKRIIRYFMTIPEATQLVLTCGALSENGELFALDMGKPMSILTMAENMIRLSGLEPYRDIDIIEIGLRPGEKLYEELLIDFEKLEKTQNDMIFVEHDLPLPASQLEEKLALLHKACDTLDAQTVYHALQQTVPTFHPAEEVNQEALESREFRMAQEQRDNVRIL